MNCDGLWKINRLKCAYDNLFVNTQEINPIQTGCINTPMRNSYFCQEHMIVEPSLNFYINDKLTPIRLSSIKQSKELILYKKFVNIHDVFCENESNKSNILYLVETEEKNFYWLKKDQIASSLLDKFMEKLSGRSNLDVFNEISCNTNKDFKTPYDCKTRTKGLLISSYNCGIVNGYRELFGSESISQVVLFYLDLIDKSSSELPGIFCYDDACHLKKFLINRKIETLSERGKQLSNKTHLIDKFHIYNHKDPYCLKNCNPYDYKEMDKLNSVVCEEINFWAGKFKYILKHMNYYRFHFYLYIIFNLYNKEKLKNQKNLDN